MADNTTDQEFPCKDTQFGGQRSNQSQNIPGSNKPWSIRKALSHLAAQKINPSDENAINKLVGGREVTIAEAIAMKTLQQAMEGDMRSIEFSDERIDGKLPNTTINADFNAITNMDGQELEEFIREVSAKTASSDGAGGEVEAAGNIEEANQPLQPVSK